MSNWCIVLRILHGIPVNSNKEKEKKAGKYSIKGNHFDKGVKKIPYWVIKQRLDSGLEK